MSHTPDRLADAIRRVLKGEMGRSPAVRGLLVELAELVLAESDALDAAADEDRSHEPPLVVDGGPSSDGPDANAAQAAADSDEEKGDAADPIPEEPVTASVPLTLGGAGATIEVKGSASDIAEVKRAAVGAADDHEPQQEAPKPKSIDLGLIEKRSRLKAESCRFFIERRRDRGDPVREPALKARMDEMIAMAKSMPECFLWVFWPHEEQPADDRLLEIAACYDALAEATVLCARVVALDGGLSESETQQAFQLLAEASSALRVALGVTWLTADDTDQEEAHLWLRRETFDRGVFVERHMKLDDPASPEHAREVIAEAKRLLAAEENRAKKARKIDQLLNKAAYHARRVRNNARPERHDLETINGVMEELRTSGVGPTDARVAEFRESIEGIEFPADLPRHEHLTFESRTGNAAAAGTDGQWNQRVAEVRPLLEGGRVVIVGGEPRREAIKRFEDAFGADVDWVELTEHGSGARMQAPIERPETRVRARAHQAHGASPRRRSPRVCPVGGRAVRQCGGGVQPEHGGGAGDVAGGGAALCRGSLIRIDLGLGFGPDPLLDPASFA